MTNEDIRWLQRFKNYQKALKRLREAVQLSKLRALSDIEKQGFIKAFEFTHELAWKVMKDYFSYQGISGIIGSRDAVRESFQYQLIKNGEGWMDMIKTRNIAVHTYDNAMVEAVIEKTVKTYHDLFVDFEKVMLRRSDEL